MNNNHKTPNARTLLGLKRITTYKPKEGKIPETVNRIVSSPI